MLRTKDLAYRYTPQSAPITFPDWELMQGDQCVLLGASGSGKSTYLQLVSGMRRATQGEIWFDEKRIDRFSESQWNDFRGAEIGMIFQKAHFIESLTVIENLTLAQKIGGTTPNITSVQALLANLQMEHKADQKTYELSQGEQQRVAIARALVNRPKLILADEPTSALDDENAIRVLELLKTQSARLGATLLIVTHDTRLKSEFDKRLEL